MTDTPMKLVVDLSKPEGERETLVPLTAEEIADLEAKQIQEAEREAARQAEAEEKQRLLDSAKAKLSKLGLSAEEVTALLG